MRFSGKIKKMVATAAVTAAMLAVGSASANAALNFSHSTTGGYMSGSAQFEPRSNHQGAFHFWGTLVDNVREGQRMYQQVKVMGYGYNTYYAPKDANQYLNWFVWDGAALQTDYARARICRDVPFWPDNCSAEKYYHR